MTLLTLRSHCRATSLGLLLVRAVCGVALALHGWPKIQNPMAWAPPQLSIPGPLQAAAAIAEFSGGIAMLIGLLTSIFALLIVITMAVAITQVHISAGHPFVGQGGPSWELAAAYLAIAMLIYLAGPGRFSVDWLLFRPKHAALSPHGSPPV